MAIFVIFVLKDQFLYQEILHRDISNSAKNKYNFHKIFNKKKFYKLIFLVKILFQHKMYKAKRLDGYLLLPKSIQNVTMIPI